MNITKHTRSLLLSAIIAGLVLASGAILAACGDDDDTSSASAGAAAQVAGNPTDRAFVKDMVPHHESAIEMATIATERGQSDFVKKLARNIIATQKTELTTLNTIASELDEAGIKAGKLGLEPHMTGMEMDAGSLRTATPFDREFIDMMVPHHQGAVRMARVELEKGESAEAKKLATQIIRTQSQEIEEMNAHRKAEFGAESPAGGVPPEDGAEEAAPHGSSSGSSH